MGFFVPRTSKRVDVPFESSTASRCLSAIFLAAPLVAAPFLPWDEAELTDLLLLPVLVLWFWFFTRNARTAVWPERPRAGEWTVVVRNSVRTHRVQPADVSQVSWEGGFRFPYRVVLIRSQGRKLSLDASSTSGFGSSRPIQEKVEQAQRWLDQLDDRRRG